MPSDLLQRRPDIAAALARVAAADGDTASAIAARYPRLTISGVIGLVATTVGGLFSPDAIGATLGPAIGGPTFDAGRSRARVEAARARALEAVASYREAVLRAFGETETAIAAVEARERQRSALQRLVAANGEASQIARLQYRSGLTDFLGPSTPNAWLFAPRSSSSPSRLSFRTRSSLCSARWAAIGAAIDLAQHAFSKSLQDGSFRASPRKVAAMSKLLSVLLAAVALATAPASAGPRVDPETVLARALEGRVAGEPVDCVNLSAVRSSRIVDRTAIIYDAGGTIYVNRPRAGRESLDSWDTLVTRTFCPGCAASMSSNCSTAPAGSRRARSSWASSCRTGG